MASNPEIKVGYNKVFGAVLLLMALLNIVLGAMVGTGASLAIGIMMTVLSILYMTMDYFVLVDGAVHIKNLLGMVMKRYPFDDIGQLELRDGKKLYLTDAHGIVKKIGVTRWLADKKTWEHFSAALDTRAFD